MHPHRRSHSPNFSLSDTVDARENKLIDTLSHVARCYIGKTHCPRARSKDPFRFHSSKAEKFTTHEMYVSLLLSREGIVDEYALRNQHVGEKSKVERVKQMSA